MGSRPYNTDWARLIQSTFVRLGPSGFYPSRALGLIHGFREYLFV